MTSSPGLREVQTLVWRLLTAPEGAADGAAALRREGVLADSDLDFLVRRSGELSPTERLDVYANMYFYRLRDCLAEDYPALGSWIGAARFHNLVTDYLLAHPSRHPSLRELGRSLPGFLESHPLSEEFGHAAGLAQLEWARLDVFDEADASVLTRDGLLAEGAAAPERFRLSLVPAVRLLGLDAGVLRLWRHLEDGGEVAPERRKASARRHGVCVWRRDFAVLHRSLDRDEEHCLHTLSRSPVSLAELGELVYEAQDDGTSAQQASQRLAELLGRWSADALLCAG